MDPLVQAALVAGLCGVLTAVLTRPTLQTRKAARQTHMAVRRVEEQFENNGGSSARDSLDRIERGLAHLTGRFDQHVEDSKNDKELAHKEAVRMWSAIEAIAQSTPPIGDRP